ncbi:MAG: glycosyl transferase [Defluviitaleaceae bacterium]|nr:glycosyl transferase [Defluviitaleaceae bacterium]MCL2261617.1 glycosyl transferase [Defluviitaleaceae bacterium]
MKKESLFKKILKFFAPMLTWVPDSLYVRVWYFYRTRKWLNLKNPKRFNDKMNWLKLYYKNPLFSKFADKYEVRDYVTNVIGEEYLIPMIGVWDTFDEIDFSTFPEQFVLKCTHDSGSVIICKDKKTFDFESAKKKLTQKLGENYFIWSREWVYKNIKPRIIVEEYLSEISEDRLRDYKFYCFHGKAKLVVVNYDRATNVKGNTYTMDWEYVPVELSFPSDPNKVISRPQTLDKMKELVEKLSADCCFMRVDMYSVDDVIYFGEMSFTPRSGGYNISPDAFNFELGSWLTLPEKM